MNLPANTIVPNTASLNTAKKHTFDGTVADVIVKALQRHQVDTIFGQSLPSALMLQAEKSGIRQIAYRTENAGGYMADGYARISHKPGIVTAQNGPAATLLVAPLAESLKASIPIIALVQDVSTQLTDRNAFQELDHLALFAGVSKWVRRITTPSRVDDYIDQAFAIACSGRPGPVVLLLPADVLLEKAQVSHRTLSLGYYPLDPVVAAPHAIKQAAELLVAADNPIIIAGGGCHLSGAYHALSCLQEQAHIPVATTVMGKGSVNEMHPLSIGVIGSNMGPNSMTYFQRHLITDADVVLLIGNRTNQNGTDSWSLYPPGATYIHLDIDSHEVGRNYESLRLVGDVRLTLDALLTELQQHSLTKREQNRERVAQSILAGIDAHLEQSHPLQSSDASPIRPERVMKELQLALNSSSIVVADASYSSIWITNYLIALQQGMRFLTPRGLAGLGWGMPMALGAKLAKSEAEVFCLVGDGGFAHVWAEMETAVRMGIKITLLLINNGVLGYQKHGEEVIFGAHTSAVNFSPVNHAQIAKATGCEGYRIEKASEIAGALEQARYSNVTTLIELMCDSNAFPPITKFTQPAAQGGQHGA